MRAEKDMNSTEKNVPLVAIFSQLFTLILTKKKPQRNSSISFIAANIFAVLALFFVMAPTVVLGEKNPPIEQITEKLQQTYDKIYDFKASFVQETIVKSIQKTDREAGIVYLKKPKNMFWNYTSPKTKKLIINPRKTWLYLPEEKVVYTQESDLIFKSKVLIKFLAGLGKLNDDFIIRYTPQETDKNGNYSLILSPREKNSGLNDFQLTLDKSNYQIIRISFDDTMGNSTVLMFTAITINSSVSEKLFQFKPPAGVNVYNMP